MRSSFTLGVAAVIALFLLFTGFQSFSSVEPGQKGVIVTMGKVVGTAEPGVFLKTPFVTNVPVLSTRDQIANFPGLTAYTRDQQVATVSNISVNYRVDPARVADVYLQYGTTEAMVEQLLNRPVGAFLEQTFGQYNAELAVRERTRLGLDFATLLKASTVGSPLIIAAVNVENFSFPKEYEDNVNNRMAAEVAALQAAETAKKTVIEAQATADSSLAVAKASAEAVRLAGEAEASAIKAKGDALRENPQLVALTKAERWDGVLPTTMLPGDTVPFLDVSALQ